MLTGLLTSQLSKQRSAIKHGAIPPDKAFAVPVNVLPKKGCRSSSHGGTAHHLASKHSLHEKQVTGDVFHPEYKFGGLKPSNLGDFTQTVLSA